MAYLEICGLRKSYVTPRGTTDVLGGVDLALEEGELVAFVGYSGSGKTTLVSLVAGLLAADGGTIVLDGQAVHEPGPERGVVFQQYSLLPWMTVYENVALAVDAVNPDLDAAARRRLTEEFVALVNLTPATRKRPRQLSGGMRQRVAVARGLAMRPKVLLMDEPFSALDALTRGMLQDEVLRICADTNQTVFMITHDVDEAILLADRIVLMTNGPGARIAEIVLNTMPKNERHRNDLHRHPQYYAIRNHLVEFLVNRSKAFDQEIAATGYDPRRVKLVKPGLAAVNPPAEIVPFRHTH
jgi:nitrate/nitrite transport system ATP-binding protein